MPWPYPGEKWIETCPCCDKEVTINGWEFGVIDLAWSSTVGRATRPLRVVCVDQNGRPVKKGCAVTVRFHGGLTDVGVIRGPKDRNGWWHPLGRVLWEIEGEKPNAQQDGSDVD